MTPDRWRLGTRNPFTVYRVADGAHDVEHAREHFVGSFRREEDARLAVDAVNARTVPRSQEAVDRVFRSLTAMRGEETIPLGVRGKIAELADQLGPACVELSSPVAEGDTVTTLAALAALPKGTWVRGADTAEAVKNGPGVAGGWHLPAVNRLASEELLLPAEITSLPTAPTEPTTPPSCDCPTTDGAVHLTLVSNPHRVGGDVTIGHSRLTAATIAALVRRGLDAEQIVGHYADVAPGQAGLLGRLVRGLDEQAEPAGSADVGRSYDPDEWVNDPSRSDHPVYECNLDRWCAMCGDPASHKVGEEAPTRVPDNTNDAMIAAGHNLTNWLCCLHFRSVIGDCGDRRTGDDRVNAPRDDPDRTTLPAGSAVGQRGAPTPYDLVEANERALTDIRFRDVWTAVATSMARGDHPSRVAHLALAALRDGGADAGGAWIRCAQQFAFVAAAGGEMPPPQCDLPRGHDGPHGWLSGRRFGVVEMDPQTGEPLTTERHRIAESVATHALDETRTRLSTALGVSLDPDDPDPVGRLMEAAGKAREVEVVSGAEAAKLPENSIVVECYADGTPFHGYETHVVRERQGRDDPAAEQPCRVLYRAPVPAPAALAVGEVVESAADLDRRATVGTIVEDASGDVDKRGPGGWRYTELAYPVTVARVGTGGGEP